MGDNETTIMMDIRDLLIEILAELRKPKEDV